MTDELKVVRPFQPYIPPNDANYVPMNIHDEVRSIIGSNRFFPAYIHGPSGIGKTKVIQQVCHETGRNFLRVQIGPESDRSSLIMKFALIGGDSVFVEGPVLSAMRSGSVLMLDELDRGTDDLMCLQGVLEGNPVLIEETGETITPAPGFTVIATGNTGGRGDMSGKFISANELDHAFLERFKVVYEMKAADKTQERDILTRYLTYLRGGKALDENDRAIIQSLVDWASNIRKTEENGDVSFSVSTRRLCFIVEKYEIDDDIHKALEACLGVYDEEIVATLKRLFKLIDPAEERRKEKARQDKAEADRKFEEKRKEAQAKAAQIASSTPVSGQKARPGSRMAFTGKLQNFSRVEATAKAREMGYDGSANTVTSKTKVLVVGDRPAQSKITKAKTLGIEILTETEWLAKYGTTTTATKTRPTTADVYSHNGF